MQISENNDNGEAKERGENVSAPNGDQPPAIAWNSARVYGQFMTAELLLSIDHHWATRFVGATFAKDSPDPFGKEPLTMTLAPDLDPNNESVRYLVKLGMLDAVECLVAPELVQRLEPDIGGRAWRIEKRDTLDVATWNTGKNTSTEIGLIWASNIPLDTLTTRFPEQLGSNTTEAIAYFRALQVHYQMPIGSLFVTQNVSVLRGRYEGWPHQIGQCTPEEALILAGLALRQRNVFVDTLRLSGKHISHRYNWYCGAAQTLLPSYLNAFADLATDAEKRNAADDLVLKYMEGILTRFKSLLRSHDQLGELHFLGLRTGANNDIIEGQGDVFYAAAQSVTGILEGIAALIAELEGTILPNDKRNVGFPSLIAGQHRWTRAITRYRPVADAAIKAHTPLLALVTGQRLQGFHYFPVMGSKGEFGEVIPITLSNGEQKARIITHLSLPLIRLPEPPDNTSWIQNGKDGLIFTENRLFLLPWLTLRSAIRDLIYLIEQTLSTLCTVREVTTSQRETVFLQQEGRDLARRMLDFGNRLHN